jgi:bifunctional non-homologous end joining protein LigD
MVVRRKRPVKAMTGAQFIAPMRPRMVSNLPDDGSAWFYEPKLDGYRAVAVKDDDGANLYSMEGKIFNEKFPRIVEALKKLAQKNFALDGELVAVEPSGRPNFNELQNSAHTKLPIYYIVFDILHFQGKALLDVLLEERKTILDKVAQEFVKPLQKVLVFPTDLDLQTIIAAVKHAKIEGLVAKRRSSKYEPGKEVDFWQKQRFNQEDQFFVGGFIPGPRGIGELLIGEYREDGKLYFVKRLIPGLNAFNRHAIFDAIQDLRTPQMSFAILPEKKSAHQHAMTEDVMAKCMWVKPEQPVEVEFVERTPHRRLRHASFRRLLPRSGDK